MLRKLFSKKSPDNTEEQQFTSLVVNRVGLSDEIFSQLFAHSVHLIVSMQKQKEVLEAIDLLLGDKFIAKYGKKPCFFVFYCLVCAELSIVAQSKEFFIQGCGKLPQEITKVHVFYSMLVKNDVGASWVSEKKEVLAEAWKYLRSGNGKFKLYVAKVLHAEFCDENGVDSDGDEMFLDSSDQTEINSMFDTVEEAESIDSLIEELVDVDSDSVKQECVDEEESVDITGLLAGKAD